MNAIPTLTKNVGSLFIFYIPLTSLSIYEYAANEELNALPTKCCLVSLMLSPIANCIIFGLKNKVANCKRKRKYKISDMDIFKAYDINYILAFA